MLINGIEINIEDIGIEDMPNSDFKDIAEVLGIEAAVKLLYFFTGNNINVPVKGFHKIERKIIAQEYDGSNQSIKRLAAKLRTTERSIRNVLESMKIEPVVEGQMNLGLFKND